MIEAKRPGWTIQEYAQGTLLAKRWETLQAQLWSEATTPSFSEDR